MLVGLLRLISAVYGTLGSWRTAKESVVGESRTTFDIPVWVAITQVT
jgi:hypothetical protein